jgi:hypothetical protein
VTFKVGDRVRCVEPYGHSLTVGEIYTVDDVTDDYVYLTSDPGAGWWHHRFELAEAKPEGNSWYADTIDLAEKVSDYASALFAFADAVLYLNNATEALGLPAINL